MYRRIVTKRLQSIMSQEPCYLLELLLNYKSPLKKTVAEIKTEPRIKVENDKFFRTIHDKGADEAYLVFWTPQLKSMHV